MIAVASHYGLDPNDQLKTRERVSDLLENDLYIFPHREVVSATFSLDSRMAYYLLMKGGGQGGEAGGRC